MSYALECSRISGRERARARVYVESFCPPIDRNRWQNRVVVRFDSKPRSSTQKFQNKACSRSLDQRSRDTHRNVLLKVDRQQNEKNRFPLWEVRQTASPDRALVYIVDRPV